MRSQWTTGTKRKEYEDPQTFGEAERRLIELDTDIKLIDAQLGDPDLKQNKSHKQYKAWRTKALRAKTRKLHDYKMIQLWMKEERERLRERLLKLEGLDNPNDPFCVLIQLHNVTKRIIKVTEAEEIVTEAQWRVIEQARVLALER